MSLRRFRLPLFGALALGALALLSYAQARRASAEQARSFGNYSRQQIVDKTLSVCRVLAPQAARPQVSVTQLIDTNVCEAHCTDETGNLLARMTWDTGTGELLNLGAQEAVKAGQHGEALSAQEAARAGKYWLKALRIAETGSRWRLVQPPRLDGLYKKVYTMSWEAPGRHAFLCLNGYDGDLISVYSYCKTARPPL